MKFETANPLTQGMFPDFASDSDCVTAEKYPDVRSYILDADENGDDIGLYLVNPYSSNGCTSKKVGELNDMCTVIK